MENMDKGLTVHCTKMGAASLTKNTPNAPKFVCPSPKGISLNKGFIRRP